MYSAGLGCAGALAEVWFFRHLTGAINCRDKLLSLDLLTGHIGGSGVGARIALNVLHEADSWRVTSNCGICTKLYGRAILFNRRGIFLVQKNNADIPQF